MQSNLSGWDLGWTRFYACLVEEKSFTSSCSSRGRRILGRSRVLQQQSWCILDDRTSRLWLQQKCSLSSAPWLWQSVDRVDCRIMFGRQWGTSKRMEWWTTSRSHSRGKPRCHKRLESRNTIKKFWLHFSASRLWMEGTNFSAHKFNMLFLWASKRACCRGHNLAWDR